MYGKMVDGFGAPMTPIPKEYTYASFKRHEEGPLPEASKR